VKQIVAFVEDPSGKTMTIAKGLPTKIINTEAGSLDDHELQWKVDKVDDKAFNNNVTTVDANLNKSGYKTIAIGVCQGDARELGASAVWKFAGLLPMLDPPRHDTPATIESLHHANISVKMITGDHVNVGKETTRLIGLGTSIYPGETMRNAPAETKNQIIWDADGFGAVLPSDKREIVLTLRNHFGLVTGSEYKLITSSIMFVLVTGDGVNDAPGGTNTHCALLCFPRQFNHILLFILASPALSAAQVGIAVDGATDAAKNAADLILTEPGLSPIYGAVLESRRIFTRIKSYVVYRVAASFDFGVDPVYRHICQGLCSRLSVCYHLGIIERYFDDPSSL